jgi:hypothetical protein
VLKLPEIQIIIHGTDAAGSRIAFGPAAAMDRRGAHGIYSIAVPMNRLLHRLLGS